MTEANKKKIESLARIPCPEHGHYRAKNPPIHTDCLDCWTQYHAKLQLKAVVEGDEDAKNRLFEVFRMVLPLCKHCVNFRRDPAGGDDHICELTGELMGPTGCCRDFERAGPDKENT